MAKDVLGAPCEITRRDQRSCCCRHAQKHMTSPNKSAQLRVVTKDEMEQFRTVSQMAIVSPVSPILNRPQHRAHLPSPQRPSPSPHCSRRPRHQSSASRGSERHRYRHDRCRHPDRRRHTSATAGLPLRVGPDTGRGGAATASRGDHAATREITTFCAASTTMRTS